MPSPFIDGFEYDRWADRTWANHLAELPDVPAATSLLAHLGATKQVWLRRLQGETLADAPVLEIWPDDSLPEAADRVESAGRAMKRYVDALAPADLDERAVYRNSSGTEFATPVRDILMHVLTHGHYHRGQIAQHVRRAGYQPVWTDYIAFSRGKEAPATPA